MLDQNTDRTYWVIGAVLIVGVLIGVAYKLFPDLFKKVLRDFSDTLGKFKDPTTAKAILPHLILPHF